MEMGIERESLSHSRREIPFPIIKAEMLHFNHKGDKYLKTQFFRFTLFLFVCFTLSTPNIEAQVVDIPDPNLRAIIEKDLGKAPGATITVEEMATLGDVGSSRNSFDAEGRNINDLTGLEFATDLASLDLSNNSISDISALAGLTDLASLDLSNNSISDIPALARLTNLDDLDLSNNSISDISVLAGLANLERLDLSNNNISDIPALVGFTDLERLDLSNNNISDISALAGLTSPRWANFDNSISDIPVLVGLTLSSTHERVWLDLSNNSISDISVLAGLTLSSTYERVWLDLSNNSISDISVLAGLTLSSTHERVWSSLSNNSILDLSNNSISDLFPLVVNTGLDDSTDIHVFGNPLSDISINTHLPTLRGRGIWGLYRSQIFLPAIAPLVVGQTFTLNLTVKYVSNLAGWQLDLAFNPAVLKAISVTEGDFLSTDGGSSFFQSGNIDNAAGSITGVSGAFIGTGGRSGTGTLLSINFEAKAAGQGLLRLSEDRLGAANGNQIHYEIFIHPVIVESSYDLNGDEKVNVLDLMLVAQNLGQANPQADANHDGTVDVFDLIAVAQHADSTPQAPSGLAYHGAALHSTTIQNWIDMAHAADDGSLAFQLGIANLKRLLAAMLPDKTALLANYPNPFNPETWIPYYLAHAADVTLTIYDIKGVVVRQLSLGYQQAGYYTERAKAAYWDGRNNLGESVGSGVYFYQLEAGNFSATRKMLILK